MLRIVVKSVFREIKYIYKYVSRDGIRKSRYVNSVRQNQVKIVNTLHSLQGILKEPNLDSNGCNISALHFT